MPRALRPLPRCFDRDNWPAVPRCMAFEAALAAYLGRPSPRAGDDLGDGGTRDGARSRRCRARGRSDRSGDEFCRERECGGAGARQAGIRRHRSRRPGISNVDLVKAAITAKTRAIMPVHFCRAAGGYGCACTGLPPQHGLRVVEDAAHAIGSRYRGKLIGSFGDLGGVQFPSRTRT